MPRVLRILNRFNLGGPTLNATYLTKYLVPEFETLLIGGKHSETEKNSDYILKEQGVNFFTLEEMKRSISLKDDLKAYQKLCQIIKEFKPDIVHTHAAKAGALGRFAAYHLNVPVIVHTFHGHVFDSYFSKVESSFYKIIERNLAAKSTKIIAVSENQKKELSEVHKICSADKIEVIPLGIDLSKFGYNKEQKRIAFRKTFNLDEDEIAIGIIGRLVPIKNHDLFLNSFKNIKETTDRKIRAFIVGDGEMKEHLKELSSELNLDFINTNGIPQNNEKASVTFTSWIEEVDNVLAGLDIVALTSLNEGTPISLIEAQAACKAIVTTDVGGIRNVVQPNETALLTPSNDEEAFTLSLKSLIEDDELRIKLAKKSCFQKLENKFGYSRLCTDMKMLYYRLLEDHKRHIS